MQDTKTCTACAQDFLISNQDFDFYSKMQVPPPTLCPECRLKRRLSFSNRRNLYRDKCDLCSAGMISMYSPEEDMAVYCFKCWWSDKWDALDYGFEYDPEKPFLDQLGELRRKVPHMPLAVDYLSVTNCDYVNHVGYSKNCYLIYMADECENVLYSEMMLGNRDCADGSMYGGSQLCYGLINSGNCYKCFFSEDCENCQEVYFSKDMNGCSNCFGCAGLRNKSYYIWNQPYSKEEYEKKIESFELHKYSSIKKWQQEAQKFWLNIPRKYAHVLRNQNVTGEYVYESKNTLDSYLIHSDAVDCRYCQFLTMSPTRDSYDYTEWGNNSERIYECISVGEGASNVKFSLQCWPNVRDVEYSMWVQNSSVIFGCVGVRNKKHCILNKQYPENEFAVLREKIIATMKEEGIYGEFFPPALNVLRYNESTAQEYFPLSEAEALKSGMGWRPSRTSEYEITLNSSDLPDSIQDSDEKMLKEIIACGSCGEAYRIVPEELKLLKRLSLPLPRACPSCRYLERLARFNQPRLWEGQCECAGSASADGVYKNTAWEHPAHASGEACKNKFQTAYAPEREDIVYCEQCYQAEIS